ncbi:uncharacterized protein LOC142176035 [Nicotiana tabacum]|uniref:Uncharacterized protein LOC142176035 n=1 Tax=Nicotiana tabacum TaxID=4097 RepID=A0AC58TPL9_TOBAC
MCNLKDKVDQNILWNVGKGNINFWYDNWSPIVPLYKMIEDDLIQQNIMIKEIYNDGQWNWSYFQVQPPDKIKLLVSQLHLILDDDTDDTSHWICSNSGRCSISTAWNLLRRKRQFSQFDSRIWHMDIPFKKSFLTRRAVHDKLSTDDKISMFGINLPSICSSCIGPTLSNRSETVEHLFCDDQYA